MSVKADRLKYLLQQNAIKACSKEEMRELYECIGAVSDEELNALMDKLYEKIVPEAKVDGIEWEYMLNQILSTRPVISMQKHRKNNWLRYAAAAAIILMLGVSGYSLFFNKKNKPTEIARTAVPNDVKSPEINRAMITLANGEKVYLDSAANGTLTAIGNVQIIKLADGKIAYKGSTNEVVYNTLTNPRGSKVIALTLADGSEIWLNSASSITYPTAFSETERRVEISGEAYFKVVHNDKKPFKVSINEMEVTDLGTEFNIRAYGDENEIQTTLIEGSVKLSHRRMSATSNPETILIKPGEQALASQNSSFKVRRPEVLNEITAWREGLFHFESTELSVILKEFSRWYDIEVKYFGNIPTDKYFLIFKRSSSLLAVLEALKATGVKFQIDGKKLLVQPG